MRTKRIFQGLFIMAFAMLFAACEYTYVEPIIVELPDDPIVFSSQLEPVFVSKCAGCHATVQPVLTTGSAYNSLINGGYINTADPANSEIYLKLSENHPSASGTFSATELAYLLKWIEEGAENN